MKKNWIAPVVESLELSATQYGGVEKVDTDGIYVNADGTFKSAFAPDPDDDDDDDEGELS